MRFQKLLLVVMVSICVPMLTVASRAASAFANAPKVDMVLVTGGCFSMGDVSGDGEAREKPVHQVCVDSFFIGKYPVTQGQYETVMGKNPSKFYACGPDCPVEMVSWEDTQEFIRRLNSMTGKNYRLPYEAEWEYAARSGGKDEQWAGTNALDKLGDYVWFGGNSKGATHRVGTKKPNGLGLYDMTGNVWQWCNDWFDATYYAHSPRMNPHGPLSGHFRVGRGGSWSRTAGYVRTTVRFNYEPSYRYFDNGFRLALPADP